MKNDQDVHRCRAKTIQDNLAPGMRDPWKTLAPIHVSHTMGQPQDCITPSRAERCRAFVRDCDAAIRRMGTIYVLPSHDLDDFVQDAWLAVLSSLQAGRFDPRRGRWDDWLFVVARNRAMTIFRKRWQTDRRVVEVPLELLESRARDEPSRLLDRLCDVEGVRQALDLLQQRTSPMTFAVFYLRHMRHCEVRQVAASLGLTPGQVRVYDHRARRKLEAILVRRGFP